MLEILKLMKRYLKNKVLKFILKLEKYLHKEINSDLNNNG